MVAANKQQREIVVFRTESTGISFFYRRKLFSFSLVCDAVVVVIGVHLNSMNHSVRAHLIE